VYVVVAVLFTAGVHVPFIEFVDVVGKFNALPLHIGAIGVNVGVVDATPVPVAVTVMAAAPPPETGISPLYASAKVGENCTYTVLRNAPPVCGILKVLINGPVADVEKEYPVNGPTLIGAEDNPAPVMVNEFGPPLDPVHTLPNELSAPAVSAGLTAETVHEMVTSSKPKP
jgi:hypothetical protein